MFIVVSFYSKLYCTTNQISQQSNRTRSSVHQEIDETGNRLFLVRDVLADITRTCNTTSGSSDFRDPGRSSLWRVCSPVVPRLDSLSESSNVCLICHQSLLALLAYSIRARSLSVKDTIICKGDLLDAPK